LLLPYTLAREWQKFEAWKNEMHQLRAFPDLECAEHRQDASLRARIGVSVISILAKCIDSA
jgi:hypothetical protein